MASIPCHVLSAERSVSLTLPLWILPSLSLTHLLPLPLPLVSLYFSLIYVSMSLCVYVLGL
jgi:hypothetical protein